jgi:hypothetical protein
MAQIRTIFYLIWIRLLKTSGSGSDFSKGPDPDPTFKKHPNLVLDTAEAKIGDFKV